MTAAQASGRADAPAGILRIGMAAASIAAALLVLALTAALGGARASLEPGDPAPPFELSTFDGDTLTLEDLRGRPVVINFWASWCKECELEAADLESVWRDYEAAGVTMLGVDYTDTEAAARAYIDRFNLTYPNGPDAGGRISRAYRVTGVPETVVVDGQGRLVALTLAGAREPKAKIVGSIVDGGGFAPADLRRVLDALVAESP